MGQRGLQGEESTPQVDAVHAVPELFRDLVHGSKAADPGIHEQHLDAAQLLGDAGECRPGGGHRAHVGAHRKHAARPGELCERRFVSTRDRHASPFGLECPRRSKADAAVAAEHDHALARKAHGVRTCRCHWPTSRAPAGPRPSALRSCSARRAGCRRPQARDRRP